MTLIYLISYFLMPTLLKVLFIVLNLTCGSPDWGSKEPWGETSARYTWRHLVQSLSHWLCPLSWEGDPVFFFFLTVQYHHVLYTILYPINIHSLTFTKKLRGKSKPCKGFKSMCHTPCTTSIVLNDSSFLDLKKCGIYHSCLDHSQPGFFS